MQHRRISSRPLLVAVAHASFFFAEIKIWRLASKPSCRSSPIFRRKVISRFFDLMKENLQKEGKNVQTKAIRSCRYEHSWSRRGCGMLWNEGFLFFDHTYDQMISEHRVVEFLCHIRSEGGKMVSSCSSFKQSRLRVHSAVGTCTEQMLTTYACGIISYSGLYLFKQTFS